MSPCVARKSLVVARGFVVLQQSIGQLRVTHEVFFVAHGFPMGGPNRSPVGRPIVDAWVTRGTTMSGSHGGHPWVTNGTAVGRRWVTYG